MGHVFLWNPDLAVCIIHFQKFSPFPPLIFTQLKLSHTGMVTILADVISFSSSSGGIFAIIKLS